jgi:hypothetical protein
VRAVIRKLVVALAVVAVVVLGIWVAGALITNRYVVATVLTVVWMGIALLACGLIVWKRRDLRVPVIAAYLLTAAVAAVYLGRSMFFDDTVDENVVTATAENRLLARGSFEPLAHPAEGVATTIRRAGGGEVLTLTDFAVSNGPDLRLYLVAGPARDESEVDSFEDLGALKGNKGDQQYDLPRGLDLDRYTTVVVWCRAFSVAFARAPLR